VAIAKAPQPEADYIRDLCAELGYDPSDFDVGFQDGAVYVVRRQQQLYETSIPRPLVDDRRDAEIKIGLSSFRLRQVDR
jgi:hypothetical protein